MSDILNKIIATKIVEVAAAKAQKPLAVVQAEAKAAETTRTADQPLSVGEVDEWLELFKSRRKDS